MIRSLHSIRLTSYADSDGSTGAIPPDELAGLAGHHDDDFTNTVEINGDTALIATADLFTPVVNEAYSWGAIAAAASLAGVYARGARPVAAVNLATWPRDTLPLELLTEVMRGARDTAERASAPVAAGPTIDAAGPAFGLAVTGIADPAKLLHHDAAEAGLPITLTKPIGVGLLNNRHQATGEVSEPAIVTMTTLNQDAAAEAVGAGLKAAAEVGSAGLVGDLFSMLRASGVAAVIDHTKVPHIDGATKALRDGYIPAATRRNLDWVRTHLDVADGFDEEQLMMLADPQTSGGLLVVGEVPGYPVIGETVPGHSGTVTVR